MLQKRQSQLELAQSASESDLTRFMEMEVATYSQRAADLKATIGENLSEINRLGQRFEEMKYKAKDMKVRQLQVIGKENATRAHHQMDKVLNPEVTAERLGSYDDMVPTLRAWERKPKKNTNAWQWNAAWKSWKKTAQNKWIWSCR